MPLGASICCAFNRRLGNAGGATRRKRATIADLPRVLVEKNIGGESIARSFLKTPIP
jgi:hypothetical protein